jgi:hypothetical protein
LKMGDTDTRDDLIVRYLLGGLDPAERERLEAEYFDDDEFFERVTAVEGELFDSYVRGELPEADRRRFESSFLSDARGRGRLAFARELRAALAREREDATPPAPALRGGATLLPFPFVRRPAFALTLAAAALALLAVVVWLAFESGRRRAAAPEQAHEVPAQPSPSEQAVTDPPRENTNVIVQTQNSPVPRPSEESGSRLTPRGDNLAPPSQRTRPAVATLLLSGVSREAGGSGRPNRLAIPAGTNAVRLVVEFGDAGLYRDYGAEVETVEGRRIGKGYSTRLSGPGRKLISVTVPAQDLKGGDYILRLRGARPGREPEVVGEYTFSVTSLNP